MSAYYCETNEILVYAASKAAAVKYAEYRLSSAYGHEEGRAANLKLKAVSAAKADELNGVATTWEA